ncbi:MAG: hypothetical protein MZV63_29540 [Marinilabiliales bacterium]|nr:hypothetical protein [Marinilabiliales bacterium]
MAKKNLTRREFVGDCRQVPELILAGKLPSCDQLLSMPGKQVDPFKTVILLGKPE